MSQKTNRIALGLSGGVDSCVAAWMLKQEGLEVIGLTMSLWDGSLPLGKEGRRGCFGPGEAGRIDAARLNAKRLGIEHHVISLADAFKAGVLDYFCGEYRRGRTPNPCVRCNQQMKFGALLDQARSLGVEFDAFATGHYARRALDEVSGRWQLLRGMDPGKDQSYFLSRLQQEQLAGVRFPLGNLTKKEVKQMAVAQGWEDLAAKGESQDFIEGDDYAVLFDPADAVPGDFVSREGQVIGRHQGLIHYTIGQRKGLGLGGGGTPWYVLELDAERNQVILGQKKKLFSRSLVAGDLNWVSWPGPPGKEMRCVAQIRQRHRAASATVTMGDDGRVHAVFDEPQLSVTPGQIVVFYEDGAVLASGVIDKAPSVEAE